VKKLNLTFIFIILSILIITFSQVSLAEEIVYSNTYDDSLEYQTIYYEHSSSSTTEYVVEQTEEIIIESSDSESTDEDDHEVVLNTINTYSANDFSGGSYYEDISICVGSTFKDTIIITNTGSVPNTYYIQTNEEVNQWVTLLPASFALQPGESKEVSAYIKAPSDAEGKYDLISYITDGSGVKKQITQDLVIGRCNNIELITEYNQISNCPCTANSFNFTLSNTGDYTETYMLYFDDLDPESYVLSENPVILAAGQSKEIYAYMKEPCHIYGNLDKTFVAYAQTSKYAAKLPIYLNIEQACYVYGTSLSELLEFTNETNTTIAFIEAVDTEYEMCDSSTGLLLANLQNNGNTINTYNLYVEDAFNAITISQDSVTLNPEQETTVSMVVNPTNVGNYSMAFKAESSRGDLLTVVPFSINVVDCTSSSLLIEGGEWWVNLLWALLILFLILILILLITLLEAKFGEGRIIGMFKKDKTNGKTTRSSKGKGKKSPWLWILPLIMLLLLIGAAVATYYVFKDTSDVISELNETNISEESSDILEEIVDENTVEEGPVDLSNIEEESSYCTFSEELLDAYQDLNELEEQVENITNDIVEVESNLTSIEDETSIEDLQTQLDSLELQKDILESMLGEKQYNLNEILEENNLTEEELDQCYEEEEEKDWSYLWDYVKWALIGLVLLALLIALIPIIISAIKNRKKAVPIKKKVVKKTKAEKRAAKKEKKKRTNIGQWLWPLLFALLIIAAIIGAIYFVKNYPFSTDDNQTRTNETETNVSDIIIDIEENVTTTEDNLTDDEEIEEEEEIIEEEVEQDEETDGNETVDDVEEITEELYVKISDLENISQDVQDIISSIDELGSDVDDLDETSSEELDALKASLEEINSNIEEKEDEINKLEDQLLMAVEIVVKADEENEDYISELEGYINELENTISALEDELSSLEEQRNDLEDRISNLEDKITGLEEDIDGLREEINRLIELIINMEDDDEDTEDVPEETTEEESAEEDISSEVEQVEEDIEEIKDDIEQTISEIVDAEIEEEGERTEGGIEKLEEPYLTILVVDTSVSSLIIENGISRFERVIESAEDYLIQDDNNEYTIIVIGKNPVIVRRDTDAYYAKRILSRLNPWETESSIGMSLKKAEDVLGEKEGEIVVFSDFINTDGYNVEDLYEDLIEKGIKITLIDVSQIVEEIEVEETEEEVCEEEPVEDETTTETIEEVEETEEPVDEVVEETSDEAQLVIDMNKNTPYELDLAQYFVDEDNDVLTFTSSENPELVIEIEESIATITPTEDWTGNATVVFVADDNKGGVTSSIVLFTVSEEEVVEKDNSVLYNKVLPLIGIIIISIIGLIVLFGGKDDDLEEVKKPKKKVSSKTNSKKKGKK